MALYPFLEGKTGKNKLYKYKPAEHSNPLKSSPRIHSQSVSDSVGIVSTYLLTSGTSTLGQPHIVTSTLPLLLLNS